MPNINSMTESKFLRKEDVASPVLLTITGVSQTNVAKEEDPPELKWCVHFAETAKPMVLNRTNAQLIAQIAQSEETDNWSRTKVVLYNDPSISFGGKLTGGIRVRAPRVKTPPAGQAQAAPVPLPPPATPTLPAEPEDDVPF
jgi:hypothetical protein